MSNFQLIFICLLIIAQCSIGLVLLYHGISILIENFEINSWKDRLFRISKQLKSAYSSPLGQKLMLVALFVVPGTIPMLIALTIWRSIKRS
ncbi:MAG: hypothetical protein HY819_09840 [Acidobacteria bacterium]|nr:hypothetical protein [Acidobacteriota bacterium]